MAKYTVIADVGEYLVELFREHMVPEILQNPEEIGLRSPEDRGDVSLGIFLYDIKQSEEIHQRRNIVTKDKITRAPIYLTLYYMITAYSSGDAKYKLAEEHRILGKVIQILHDNPVIPLEAIDKEQTTGTELHIHMMRTTVDEKSRVWSFPNVGNRLTLFYRVSPVTIDSSISKKVKRVTELDINVNTILGEK